MRRITKIGAVALALLLGIPALAVFDLFGSAVATGDAPLLYAESTDGVVKLIDYADASGSTTRYAYVLQDPANDTSRLIIREKQQSTPPLYDTDFDTDPLHRNITSIALSRDGSTLVAGFAEGYLLYLTASSNGAFARSTVFQTRSPVTDVDVGPDGRFYTAVTYYGDLYVFERERFAADRTPYFHHHPLVPFALTHPEGAIAQALFGDGHYPEDTGELVTALTEDTPAEDAAELVPIIELPLRPYQHVRLVGTSLAGSPNRLGVAVADIYGSVHVFNVDDFDGTDGLTAEPESHDLVRSECDRVFAAGSNVEIPCNARAFAQLLEEANTATGGLARDVLLPVADAVRGLTPLDTLASTFASPSGLLPVRSLDGTHAAANGQPQTIVAVVHEPDADEPHRVHALTSRFGIDRGATDTSQPTWVIEDAGEIRDVAISERHTQRGTATVTVALGNSDGELRIYRPGSSASPTPTFIKDFDGSGAPVAIEHVGISRGSGAGQSNAGKYVSLVTSDGQLHLVETDRVETAPSGAAPGVPHHHYAGTIPFLGDVPELDMTDGGGLLLSHGSDGFSLYGDLLSVRIQAPTRADKFTSWSAQAIVVAPDSTAVDHQWTITPSEPTNPAPTETLNGATITHTFGHRGTYRVALTVTDDNQITAIASTTVAIEVEVPVIKMTGPKTVAVNETVHLDFNGTHDPDADPAHPHLGIESITVSPGDGRPSFQADLDGLNASLVFDTKGTYTITAEAIDVDAIKAIDTHTVEVIDDSQPPLPCDPLAVPADPNCGDPDEGEPDDGIDPDDEGATDPTRPRDDDEFGVNHNLSLRRVDTGLSGHSVSYGGNGAGKGWFVLRNPNGTFLGGVGTSRDSPLDSHIRAAAIYPDGTGIIGGLVGGGAIVAYSHAPQNYHKQVLGPRTWVSVEIDDRGERALLVDQQGLLTMRTTDLFVEHGSFDLETRVKAVEVDARLHTIVVIGTDNVARLFDGRNITKGPQHTYTISDTVSTARLTSLPGTTGTHYLLVGKTNGQIEVVRIQDWRFALAGRVDVDPGKRVWDIEITPMRGEQGYSAAVTTRGPRTCTGIGNSCGVLALLDTRARDSADIVEPGKPFVHHTRGLPFRVKDLMMSADARHFAVGAGDHAHVALYDSIWEENDPLVVYTGLGASVRDLDGDARGSTHFLLTNNKLRWMFAPPTAEFQIGPHDRHDIPQYGGFLHVRTNITFDGSLTDPGDGALTGSTWEYGDGHTESGLVTIHSYFTKNDCNASGIRHTCNLRLTVRAQHPDAGDLVLQDRVQVKKQLFDPAPVAHLKASPFNTTRDQVEVDSKQTVTFDASDSFDRAPNAEIVSYRFAFGDGTSSYVFGPTITHQYARPGVYLATVVVKDRDSFLDESDPITVVVDNVAPTARIRYTQPGGNESAGTVTAGLPVQFDGRASSDADGAISAYEWYFLNGFGNHTDTGALPTFTWESYGTFEVGLRVRDTAGTWSPWVKTTLNVDDAIRLEQQHRNPDKRYLNPTNTIWVDGFVHDFIAHPANGNPIAGATIRAKLYYDGPYNATRADTPYQTAQLVTAADGKARFVLEKNDAGVAYMPGRYRVEMLAEWDASHGGNTEYSRVIETVFFVENST